MQLTSEKPFAMGLVSLAKLVEHFLEEPAAVTVAAADLSMFHRPGDQGLIGYHGAQPVQFGRLAAVLPIDRGR